MLIIVRVVGAIAASGGGGADACAGHPDDDAPCRTRGETPRLSKNCWKNMWFYSVLTVVLLHKVVI